MTDIYKNIEDIINDCNDNIGNNLMGLNYLEKLKYILIEKIRELSKVNLKNFKDNKNQVIKNQYNKNNLTINIIFNLDPLLKIKKSIESDTLCIVIEGYNSFKIFDTLNAKASHSLNLFANMGLVLSKDMVISESIGKNSVLLYIQNTVEI